MDYLPKIDVENIKECQDAYTLIDLLKSGYRQSINENDYNKKIRQRNNNFSDVAFARYSALNSSFNQTIVLLEKLEQQIEKLDKEYITAQAMAGDDYGF